MKTLHSKTALSILNTASSLMAAVFPLEADSHPFWLAFCKQALLYNTHCRARSWPKPTDTKQKITAGKQRAKQVLICLTLSVCTPLPPPCICSARDTFCHQHYLTFIPLTNKQLQKLTSHAHPDKQPYTCLHISTPLPLLPLASDLFMGAD